MEDYKDRGDRGGYGDRGDRGDRGGDGDRGDFRGGGGGRRGGGGGFGRKKMCRFCADKIRLPDYKDIHRIASYITERGKIVPARISGNCASHQRLLTKAVKLNRCLAMLPVTALPLPLF